MRHDYNVTGHDYTVKQHDYNVKRHDYTVSWPGSHKVLSKFACFASFLFGLNHFISSSILPGFGRICSLCFVPAKFWTNPVRFVSFL
jgi:hypothetical protein